MAVHVTVTQQNKNLCENMHISNFDSLGGWRHEPYLLFNTKLFNPKAPRRIARALLLSCPGVIGDSKSFSSAFCLSSFTQNSSHDLRWGLVWRIPTSPTWTWSVRARGSEGLPELPRATWVASAVWTHPETPKTPRTHQNQRKNYARAWILN